MVLLLCMFGWLMLGDLSDSIPQGIAIAGACTLALLAALAAIQIVRRHARRAVLIPIAGEVGVYRDGRFAYRFAGSALRREGMDWVYPIKMLVLIGLLVLLTGGLLAVQLRDAAKATQDLWVIGFLFGYACCAFAAIVRSQFLIVWYWIPDGPAGGTRRVGFFRRRARSLQPAAASPHASPQT